MAKGNGDRNWSYGDEQAVRAGVQHIAAWRTASPHKSLRLEGVQLKDADLAGADLRGVNLAGASLNRANLAGANLEDANLRAAKLHGADLRESQLRRAVLDSAKLGQADIRKAQLRRCSMVGAFLEGANLENADLGGARLTQAHLGGANLRNTRLRGVKDINLVGAYGYVLDGEDISTWRLPPSTLFPRLRRQASKDGPGRWTLHWSYSDPWSTLRRSYTGTMMAFHLILAVAALGPYGLRALLANVGDHGLPRVAVALGWDAKNARLLVPCGLVLVAYNGLRILATWWLSQLREEELRSRRAPKKNDYWPMWLVHAFFMRWVGVAALASGVLRSVLWLSEPV